MNTPDSPLVPIGEVRMVSRYSLWMRLSVIAWVAFTCLIAGMIGLTAAGFLFGTISGY